jgi:hypothetical protein
MLGQSHGFNSVHGRMPSVLTGANLANRNLIYLGVSGDGDTASIGLGQFAHAMRRGVNMVYIVENNGVYGLTKGQFSATADLGSKSKKGSRALDQPIDLVGMAIGLGASFVGLSFSGDKAQLVPLIKGAFEHKGAAFIDVISPCVTFSNHVGSTKSFDYVREHNIAVNALDVISEREQIEVDYAEGASRAVMMHDGSTIVAQARRRPSPRPVSGPRHARARPHHRRNRHPASSTSMTWPTSCTTFSAPPTAPSTNSRSTSYARDRRRCRQSTPRSDRRYETVECGFCLRTVEADS